MKKFILFIIFSLLMIGLSAAEETNNQLWISIVRADGILVPIGTYDNGTWLKTWPDTEDAEPTANILIKVKNGKLLIQDIPSVWLVKNKKMPKEWYLWTRKAEPSSINVINAEQYKSHCSTGWALKTDLLPEKLEESWPMVKLGVATNSRPEVNPIMIIDKTTKDALPVLTTIKAKFVEKEREAINANIKNENDIYLEDTGHPVSFEARNKNTIEIKNIYKTRYKVNGNNLYFVEARRKYRGKYRVINDRQETDCESVTVLNSWVVMKNNKVSFLNSEIILTDQDGKGDHDIVPHVVLSVDGRHYIVSENYGYESESYTIYEIIDTSIKKILKVDGGGC